MKDVAESSNYDPVRSVLNGTTRINPTDILIERALCAYNLKTSVTIFYESAFSTAA